MRTSPRATRTATQQLADALIARGIYKSGGGVAWEYYFPFSGGRRGVDLRDGAGRRRAGVRSRGDARSRTRRPRYQRAARAAYAAIPRPPADERRGRAVDPPLLVPVDAGPERAAAGGDLACVVRDRRGGRGRGGARDADAASAAATLARFDTGYWTYYALPRDYSPTSTTSSTSSSS